MCIAKRPAQDDDSSTTSKKRPALEKMTKAEADRFFVTNPVPTAPKKQTTYQRFKTLLLQEEKASGNKTVISASDLKAAWGSVKGIESKLKCSSTEREAFIELCMKPSQLDPSNISAKNTRLLALAIKQEETEKEAYEEAMVTFKAKFVDAAIAVFLDYQERDMDPSNTKFIQNAHMTIESIHSKAVLTYGENIPDEFNEAYIKAKKKIDSIMIEVGANELVKTLLGASKEVLLNHARKHCELLQQVEELNSIKAKANALEVDKKKEEDKELERAHKIKEDICKQLNKQMVYTNSNLKYASKKISYTQSGVSLKVFAAAFNVPEGTKEVEFCGSDVGYKPLRYSLLGCGTVKVTLRGNNMSANTSYKIV